MADLTGLLLVAIGGLLGGMTRFWVSGVVARRIGETFPWGTLVVNVTGALAVGALAGAALSVDGIIDLPAFREVAIVGFLGGYTTVSSFSLQTLALASDGGIFRAAMNVLLSVGLCVSAVGLGFMAATQGLP